MSGENKSSVSGWFGLPLWADRALARALAGTYDRRLTAFRPRPEGEETVWAKVPCALSRTAKTAAPAPAGLDAPLAESRYALTLYTPPGVWLRLGDRLEISDGTGRTYHARASDSVAYASHCVTVAEVLEVTEPETADEGSDAGETRAGDAGTAAAESGTGSEG